MAMKGLGHFSEPGFCVLVVLLEGPRHGYAIGAGIQELTGRAPGPGSLYGAISRLERLGLVAVLPGDGRRKPYELTVEGAAEVRRQIEELDRLARRVGVRLERAAGAPA